MLNAGKDESATDNWRHNSADSIKRLCEVQPALRRFRRTENSDIRIGGYFQHSLTAGHHKKREEEEPVKPDRSCRNEEKRANRTGEQSQQNSLFVTYAFHQPSGRQSSQKIAAKERRLNQR